LKLVTNCHTDYLFALISLIDVFGLTFRIFFSAKISVSSIKFSSFTISLVGYINFFTEGLNVDPN